MESTGDYSKPVYFLLEQQDLALRAGSRRTGQGAAPRVAQDLRAGCGVDSEDHRAGSLPSRLEHFEAYRQLAVSSIPATGAP